MRHPLAGALLVATVLLGACAEDDVPRGDPVAGEAVVEDLSPSCGMCHSLESADFVGIAAPDLDQLQPGYERVLDAMRNGPGAMPSYSGILTEAEMHDVAAYVSDEAGS